MRPAAVRVLVVDDSAFARKVVREVLQKSPLLEVVGIARDGLDALEMIADLKPDVITLDLVMPQLDGLGVLRALSEQESPPRVVVVSMADEDSELGVAALVAGAYDVVHKPTALATDRLYELGAELVDAVIGAASATTQRLSMVPVVVTPVPVPQVVHGARLLVIGASTGGPQALTKILRSLPATFPVPIALVLHMPAGYTESCAKRLDGECALDIRAARDGLLIDPGMAIVGRAGMHTIIETDSHGHIRVRLSVEPIHSAHRPSVDVLFESAANALGGSVVGVVLTGMGNDGLAGSRVLHAAGGRIITESPSSCIVYGMPRVVFEAGLAVAQAPLDDIVPEILRQL
jgi:two-component system chemotaxis response regulator CheB